MKHVNFNQNICSSLNPFWDMLDFENEFCETRLDVNKSRRHRNTTGRSWSKFPRHGNTVSENNVETKETILILYAVQIKLNTGKTKYCPI
jgi:hypothetical protein